MSTAGSRVRALAAVLQSLCRFLTRTELLRRWRVAPSVDMHTCPRYRNKRFRL